ncbi:MAG: MYXO-CTERM sorting domain-containing protein, partial [Deltaproteobacteria bacterium]|nr:MYXO-CTERM sorting domain-containing protein [Deltaproteobacteria bacterium]
TADGGGTTGTDGGRRPRSRASDAGCACRAAGQGGLPETGLLLFGLAAVAWLRRRR